NAALEPATGDYAFWLDADDVLEPEQRGKLVALLEGLGLVVVRAFQLEAVGPDPARSDGVRLESPTDEDRSDRVGLASPTDDGSAPTACVVRCACDPGATGSGGQTVVDHIRMFPIRPDVRWTYRVHEQILPRCDGRGSPSDGPTWSSATPAIS